MLTSPCSLGPQGSGWINYPVIQEDSKDRIEIFWVLREWERLSARPCIQSASLRTSVSMATGSSLSPIFFFERSRLVCNSSWQALQLWAALAFLQRTSSRRRGRNCHVCWLVIRSQSHPESWKLKLNYTLLVPIKQCTPSLAFYLKYNPVPWTLSRPSEWWHLTTSHTRCQIAMTFTGNVRKGTANYYYSTHS